MIAAVAGFIGFLLGPAKLAKFLGILWGTDSEFNQKVRELNDNLDSNVHSIPRWIAVCVLGVVIVGTYGYVLTMLSQPE